MSHLAPTADLSRKWCPGCDPLADPTLEILQTEWCEAHKPGVRGEDDDVAGYEQPPSGGCEAEGVVCKRMQDLLR
jgi:hypothetical protein